ncbi:pyridoxal phosphate-dependent decarboxylase family protein [Planctomicrobium sp. SH668]|uniref:pyridoxal phosphate-dependent decarboxylase family protein n=1 Tax=Planctomicrobium sp. SH668 TaxID=3448126 RepID=UPI003F5B1E2D
MFLTSAHLELFQRCQQTLALGFSDLPEIQLPEVTRRMEEVLQQTAVKLQDNYPYQHPLYLGQMLRPPHPVAHLAYMLAMNLNPNNHAHDGGRATSALELDVVSQIAAMFGLSTHLGHLTGGGTMANFEALWVARELTEGKAVAASSQAHYTHSRLSNVLQVPFHPVPVDSRGRIDVAELERLLKDEEIGTVVVTLGTTGFGAVDPLDQILLLRERYSFRVHVDAAYGGYFRLASHLDTDVKRAFDATSEVDSIVVDPHKHGLQPYGCGCVLFRNRNVAAIYHHESPYTYFTSDELHLGEISLECSRAGAGAAALWATMQLLPTIPGGEFAGQLDQCCLAARQLAGWIESESHFHLVTQPQLDIVVWNFQAESSSLASEKARQFFNQAAKNNIHLALLSLPRSYFSGDHSIETWDTDEVTCLRTCLMKQEHFEWMPRIIQALEKTLNDVLSQ